MSLNTKKSLNLYNHLSSRQKAILAFNLQTGEPVPEIERILQTVPYHHYRQRDDAFCSTVERLVSFIGYVGVDFWKLEAMIYLHGHLLTMYEAREVAHYREHGKLDTELEKDIDDMLAEIKKLNAQKSALLQAANEMMDRLGIDADTLAARINASREIMQSPAEPCDKYLKTYRDALAEFESTLAA